MASDKEFLNDIKHHDLAAAEARARTIDPTGSVHIETTGPSTTVVTTTSVSGAAPSEVQQKIQSVIQSDAQLQHAVATRDMYQIQGRLAQLFPDSLVSVSPEGIIKLVKRPDGDAPEGSPAAAESP